MNLEQKGVYKIEFTKKDGSQRLMIGTIDLDLIPKEKHPKGVGIVNESVQTIFDLENKDWRSYRVDSLIACQKLESYVV